MVTVEALLQPFQMHDLDLKNRVALAPMTRARAGVSRIPNEIMAEYYAQRSNAGLVITEATVIADYAIGWNDTPGIYTEDMTKGWARVVDAVHAASSKVFLQLWHCGRASHSSFLNGNLPTAPSAIAIANDMIHTPLGKQPYEIPRALTTEEIPKIIEDYRHAAKRAREAGFDGIEVHGANGYLIDTFLQSKTNQRTDQYGGSIENRYRFLNEVLEAVSQEFPAHRIGVRLSPNGVYNDMGSLDYREQFSYVASQLNKRGLAYLHVMNGLGFGFHGLGEPMTLQEFRNVFDGPIIGNCGYTIEAAEHDVKAGLADLIAIGRPFISNPDLVERLQNGWSLADIADVKDWYSPTGAQGYTDFPAYKA